MNRRDLLAVLGATAAGSLAGCTGSPLPDGGAPEPEVLSSDLSRETPDATGGALRTLVEGNTAFALALHRTLVESSPDANLFVSPYSVSIALAMTWAGARGETATAMAEALRHRLSGERLHPAFNALDRAIDARDEVEVEEGRPFELSTVNAIWGQRDYPFREAYLDTLAVNYGAGVHVVDFAAEPDAARERINAWVREQTEGRIEDLLPEGVVDPLTRLVLTNAIYFRANWASPFPERATENAPFAALDGTESAVPMMRQSGSFPYAAVDGHQVIELPYVGNDASMVVILPDAFEAFERSLDAERLEELLSALEPRQGTLRMPRFAFESSASLKDALSALGMAAAFDPERADFGGMADLEAAGETLFLQAVLHRATVAVDEEGTEAAAATAVVAGTTSAPADPFEVTVDRPFLFLIRDRPTGTVLFLGRVVDAGRAQE